MPRSFVFLAFFCGEIAFASLGESGWIRLNPPRGSAFEPSRQRQLHGGRSLNQTILAGLGGTWLGGFGGCRRRGFGVIGDDLPIAQECGLSFHDDGPCQNGFVCPARSLENGRILAFPALSEYWGGLNWSRPGWASDSGAPQPPSGLADLVCRPKVARGTGNLGLVCLNAVGVGRRDGRK